ncbi:hypothetical protein U9M48_018007 [Paspalum notatum var. saurae]|uniref:Uncharacterized protein n=1 Tax=Paspalum notatum var. saurae TaxID=547442 RepID=A0AAQ3WPG1_PASNO
MPGAGPPTALLRALGLGFGARMKFRPRRVRGYTDGNCQPSRLLPPPKEIERVGCRDRPTDCREARFSPSTPAAAEACRRVQCRCLLLVHEQQVQACGLAEEKGPAGGGRGQYLTLDKHVSPVSNNKVALLILQPWLAERFSANAAPDFSSRKEMVRSTEERKVAFLFRSLRDSSG